MYSPHNLQETTWRVYLSSDKMWKVILSCQRNTSDSVAQSYSFGTLCCCFHQTCTFIINHRFIVQLLAGNIASQLYFHHFYILKWLSFRHQASLLCFCEKKIWTQACPRQIARPISVRPRWPIASFTLTPTQEQLEASIRSKNCPALGNWAWTVHQHRSQTNMQIIQTGKL